MTVSPQQAMHPVTLKNLLLAHTVGSLFTPRWLCFFVPMRLYKWLHDCKIALSFSNILLAPHTVYVLCVYIHIFISLTPKRHPRHAKPNYSHILKF